MSIDLHENDFDAFMKNKFEGHTSSPPPEYWDQIENQLNHQNFVHHRRIIRYWLGAAAAATIILMVSLYSIFNENPDDSSKYSNIIHPSVQKEKDLNQLSTDNPVHKTHKIVRITQNPIPETQNNSFSSKAKHNLSFQKTTPQNTEPDAVSNNTNNTGTTIAFKNTEQLKDSYIKNAYNDSVRKQQFISPLTNAGITMETALSENTLSNSNDSILFHTPLSDTLILPSTGNSASMGTQKHRISYELYFAPAYSYRTLIDNSTYYNSEYNKAYFDKRDKGYFTFSTGLLANYRINSKISVSSGLSYSQYSQEFSTESFHVNYDGTQDAWIYTSSGDLHFKITASDTISQNDILRSSIRFSYINIPVLLEYRFAKNYFIDAGISYSYLISQTLNLKAENYEGNCETTPITGLKKNSLCLNVGIGKEIPLKNSFSIIIQPSINIFITAINDKASVKSYPFSIGLQTGLRYSL